MTWSTLLIFVLGLILVVGFSIYSIDGFNEKKFKRSCLTGTLAIFILLFGFIIPFFIGKTPYENHLIDIENRAVEAYRAGNETLGVKLEEEWQDLQGLNTRVRKGSIIKRPTVYIINSIHFGWKEELKWFNGASENNQTQPNWRNNIPDEFYKQL